MKSLVEAVLEKQWKEREVKRRNAKPDLDPRPTEYRKKRKAGAVKQVGKWQPPAWKRCKVCGKQLKFELHQIDCPEIGR